jgi:hypothetical protein
VSMLIGLLAGFFGVVVAAVCMALFAGDAETISAITTGDVMLTLAVSGTAFFITAGINYQAVVSGRELRDELRELQDLMRLAVNPGEEGGDTT